MKKLFLLAFAGIFLQAGFCQQRATDFSVSGIMNDLQRLPVFGKVLYIAAHPDDENTRLLAWLANEKHYRTGYLSLTRGDGGQNLIGDEQGIELGLIRTQELLAARRVDGAEQFFSRAYDFGYSKSPEETMNFWGHDKILSDVVWVIRRFQPDVIITRFPTTGEGGHGHHTASAILAGEAFDAAADPSRFPEQLQNGITVWKAKSLLWNTFNFGGNNTTREDQLKIDVGGYNVILGKSYGEIAAQSRSQHKSQGFGVPSQRGESFEYFATIKGETPGPDLLPVTVKSTPDILGASYQSSVDAIIAEFNPFHPVNSVPALVSLYKNLSAMSQGYWQSRKLKEVSRLIEAASGIFMEASTTSPFAVQGDSLPVNFSFVNRENINVQQVNVGFKGWQSGLSIAPNKTNSITNKFFFPQNTSLSQPYWLAAPMEKGSFVVTNPILIGNAENELPMAVFNVNINGQDVAFEKPVLYKFTDPVAGEVYRPYTVVPPLSMRLSPTVRVDFNGKPAPAQVQYRLFAPGNKLPATTPDYAVLSGLPAEGKYNGVLMASQAMIDANGQITMNDATKQPYYNFHEINYDHIPVVRYFSPASQRHVQASLKIAGMRIGYIAGAGDKVPQSLMQMGYEVTMLSEADITLSGLKKYDALVTGVRAYNILSWLPNVYSTLMAYVQDGGVMLVQYNTNSNLGPMKNMIGPYPFTISRNRVTDETAKVDFIQPANPLLNYPNKITSADFEGWIQERSIYNATEIDNHYNRILSMADPKETAQDGSLIAADYGKGRFIYTGLVFFRELPAGVPGAYRLFANLLARPKLNATK